MARGFFVAYCLQTLREPKFYKLEYAAIRLCENTPNMKYQAFSDEKQAKAFLEQHLHRFHLASRQKSMAIVQSHLNIVTPQQSVPPKQGDKPEEKSAQVKETIGAEKRQQREEQVGKLFVEHRLFKADSFKSTLSVIDRSLQYLGYFDGCSKNNPGLSGAGYHIDHPVTRTTLISRSQFIGVNRTNNQAELLALNLLLADAYCNDIPAMTVFGDSELVIKFMRGQYKTVNQYLKLMVKPAFWLAKKFQRVQFEHIGRAYNTKADRLSNLALKKRKQQPTETTNNQPNLQNIKGI